MGNQATERFQTGNHVRLYFSGDGTRVVIGTGEIGAYSEGTSIDFSADTGAREVHTIGTPEPLDIVDGPHSYRITLASVKLRSREYADRIVNGDPINVEAIDQFNDKLIAVAEECRVANARYAIPANQLVTKNLQLIAMRIR